MSDCCRRVPALCVVCDRQTCMTCRRLSTRSFDSEKTGVVCCVECDPENEFVMGRLDEGMARIHRADRFLKQWRDEAPGIIGLENEVPRVVNLLVREIINLRQRQR